MPSVQAIAEAIVVREGGYVNDPDDPGGATKFGVTIHTMRRLGLDLPGDGAVTSADVRTLTRTEAVRIFIEEYFRRPRLHWLPEPLQASVFDMTVNAGRNGVKILQRLVTSMGFPATADGVMGPKTRAAVDRAYAAAPHHTVRRGWKPHRRN